MESNENKQEGSAGLNAIVIGGSGAVGKALVKELINSKDIGFITSLSRRELPLELNEEENKLKNKKLIEKIVSMDELGKHKDQFAGKDVAFCCLGTTTSEAKTEEGFRKVDYDLVVKFGELAKESGVPHMNLMSTMGANATSWFMYSRVKGQADDFVKGLGFSRMSLYRPGVLDRGKDARLKEKIGGLFGSTTVTAVAKAMLACTLEQFKSKDKQKENKVDIFDTAQIKKIASQK